jgi:carbamoyltransferase
MNIIGVSCYYHDAAACLVTDGKVLAAVEEERLTRKKHDNRFPELAIDWCLRQTGLDIGSVDAVVFYEKPAEKLDRTLRIGTLTSLHRFST